MRYFPEKIQIVETQSVLNFLIIPLFFSAPSKGEYTLEVTYRSEIFDGENGLLIQNLIPSKKRSLCEKTADVPPGNDKPERENPGNESPNGKPNWKTFSIRIGQQKESEKWHSRTPKKRENLITRC